MGTVYLAARADEQFHKRVALKVIRAGADSAEVIRHFKRERQILASLDHPNIAKLLDGGTTEDGLPYLVMEYIEGEAFLQYCDARMLPIPERLKMFQAICSAVQYAHRNLIVHRDIKPGNILIAADGAPKLLDFGIAKLLNPEMAGEAPSATAMAMTPEYASPEQARGERITTATDVYSLGVVLYELLTGQKPYNLTGRQPLDVLKAISEQEPERASTRKGIPEKLQRALRGDLDNILMTALRKEPQRRYASVESFSDDVRRYLTGLPVSARKPTVRYRTGKFMRRHGVAVAASLTVVLLLVGFAVAMAVQSDRLARERDVAQKERAAAQRERETAQRVSAFLVDLFKVSDPGEARANTITAREVLDKGADKIATELKDQPEIRGALMATMGNVYLNLGLYDKSIALNKEAVETRRAVLGSDHPDVAETLNNLAVVLEYKGDFDAAETAHREALAVRRRLFGSEHAAVATSLNNLANVLDAKGDYTGAEQMHREALAIRRKLFGHEHADVARSLLNLANVLRRTGDYVGAEVLLREGLAVRRKLLGNESRGVAVSLMHLGNVLAAKGDSQAAEAHFRESVVILRKVLGPDHPEVAKAMDNVAMTLAERGDHAGAEVLFRETIPMLRRSLGDEHPDVGMGLASLATTLCDLNRPREGELLARQAHGIFSKVFAAGHPAIAELDSILGGCLTLARRFAEAEPLLVGGHAVLEAKTGSQTRETTLARARLVRLYDAWGKSDLAARYRAAPPATVAAR